MAYGTFAFGEKAGQLTPDSINSLKLAISGLNKEQAILALSTRGLSEAQQKQVLVDAGLIATNERISAGIVKQALVTNGLDKEQQEAILTKAGLMHEDSKLLLSGEAVSAQKLKQILIENGYQEEQAETLINSIIQEGQNYDEALSWEVLGTKAKKAAIAMLHNPLTWIVVAIASIGLLVKGYDAVIGRQEKLSRQKIEGLDKNISKLDEEIKTLEELQSKLEDAKGSRYELSQIQTELNDAIGETKGLLNGEGKAWDIANAKLKANIELKKQQKKQAQQDKVDESKDLYDSNSMEIDWRLDISGDKAREYAEALSWLDGKSFDVVWGSLSTEQQDLLWEAMSIKGSYTEEWSTYWQEQVDTAYDVFEETIENYDGIGGQDFIKGLISDMVYDGKSLSEISEVVTQVINNQDMQDAINKYWESLVNPDINSEEALQAVKKIFDDIVAKNPALKDFFDNFYNSTVAGSKAVKSTSSDINEMTVSLSNLEKASDNIKAIGSAYKELSSDGYITIKTLSEIKTATGLSGNEWEEYQIKLLNAKAGSSEFNQIMSDLTYKILDNTFAGAELNDLTEQQIIATLRENGVINASAVAHDWLAKAKAKEKIASMELVKGSNLDIAALTSEATACGVTKNAYLELVAKEILFNRNDLDVDDKIKKLNQIAVAAGIAGINMDDLNSKFGSQGEKHKYIKENGGEVTTTYKMLPSSATSPVKDLGFYDTNGDLIIYSSDGLTITRAFGGSKDETSAPLYEYAEAIYSYNFEDGTKLTDVDDAVKYGAMLSLGKRITDITNNITIPNYGGVGTGNEHSYEDLTDAIINRINLRSKELEQQEESIDNALELAKYEKNNEKRYEKQVSLLTEKSTIQKQRLGEIVKANNDIHKVAEELRNSTPDWDEESWFDSQGEATEAYLNLYNNSTKEQKEALSDQFDKLSKLKKAWYENDEDRLALEKDILDTEEEILDLRGEYFNDATDFHSSYFDSRISVLKAQYELENSIAEARHELNKELETSKTMYEYLDEETRELLFNQEDYNELAEELLSIEKMGARLQRQYERDLENATLETVEEITANYERQYETLMKSYEIAKADLEIAKKKQQLNNVLNERNVRMFLDGQWRWVANTEEVAKAKSELADAEYAKRVAKAGLKQQESINNLTLQQDQLGVVVKKFEGGVITLDEAVADAAEAIGKLPKALQEMYQNASKGSTSSSSGGGSSSLKGSSSGGGNKSSSSSGGNSSSTMSITVQTGNIYPEGVTPIVTPFPGGDSSSNGVNTTDQYVTSDSGIINSNPNWDGKKKGSIGIEKHADGTRYTPGGLTLMGEEGSEIYITASGRLIPINQPTIGNIPSGGVVFNREQMNGIRSLWDMSNMKLTSDKTQIERQPQQIDQSQDNRIIINGMTVDSGSSDGQALISALRRYVSNH